MGNKFKVNTYGIQELGKVEVQGGKILCTLNEFIDMHSEGCIYRDGDVIDVYYIDNKFLEVQDVLYLPYWEGKNYVCFLSWKCTQGEVEDTVVYTSSLEFQIEDSKFPVPLLEPVSFML